MRPAALPLSLILLSQVAALGRQPEDPQRREASLNSALELAEAARPAQPGRVDLAMLQLANFLTGQGRYREAEPLYLRSNTFNEANFGPSSLEAANSQLRLGAIYHAELRYPEAEAAARKAAELLQTLTGDESEAYAAASANLAVILADQGQPARAEPLLRRALFILRKHGAPEMATVEENLGMVHLRQGEYAQAEPLLEEALNKLRAALDPSEAITLAALAELSIAEDRWPRADTQLRAASKIVLERFGDGHPWLPGILHLEAAVESHAGNWRQASLDMKRAIAILESVTGADSPRAVIFLKDYAVILRHLGRCPEAKAERNRVQSLLSHRR